VTPSAATNYWCKITGSCGTANSNTATVTVCPVTTITQQPATVVVTNGQSGTLSVTATGSNLTYQWYQGASGDTTHPITDTTASLTYSTSNYGSYQAWVKVTGTCGSTQSAVNSNAAWISVRPSVTPLPSETYLSSGSRAALSVVAGGTAPLHYQWTDISSGPVGTDSPTFITPDITASKSYYCVVTTGAGNASTTTNTASLDLCSGSTVTASVVNNGSCRYLVGNPQGNYDTLTWYKGQRGDTSQPVSTSPLYNVCPSTSTTYWCRIGFTDSNQQVTCYADSNAVTVP
jgi:hypothetical protein